MQRGRGRSPVQRAGLVAAHRTDLDAAVQQPALVRLVAGDRIRLAGAAGADARGTHTLLDQVVTNHSGSTLAETLVVSVGADAVGVPLKIDAQLTVLGDQLLDLCGCLVERALGVCLLYTSPSPRDA